jgi:hypothetical protein
MERERDKTETPATLLNEFVGYRNKAAHMSVVETVATEEIKSIADCVMVICEALAQVVKRREELGQMGNIGEVVHEFSDRIVGVRMHAGAIATGDEVVVVQKYACYAVGVQSIQSEHIPYERPDLKGGQEIGLRLSAPAKNGARLMKLRTAPQQPSREAPSDATPPNQGPMNEPEEASSEMDEVSLEGIDSETS